MNKKPFLYNIGVKVLGKFYRWYYSPKIEGIENLNTEGPVIIASNHIHLYDQCNILISTNNFITYMAKKEYFDSKKTRWFFKSVGCIPVDRAKKDDSAVTSALNVLRKKGYVGIFPEGTRNRLKPEKIDEIYDEYFFNYEYLDYIKKIKSNDFFTSQINYIIDLYKSKKISLEEFYGSLDHVDSYLKNKLKKKDYYETLMLPFKFGTVSMASKTNALIVPVIVKGDYRFKSDNLIIKIGKPINIQEMDLKDANDLLRKEMINLLKEGK